MLVRNIAHAIRGFGRTPAFTLVALGTLALGIGANTTIFSIVDAVLLEPLPYPESDRLVDVSHTAPGLDLDRLPTSRATYVVYADARSLEEIALYQTGSANLVTDGRPDRIVIGRATPSLFRVLRAEAGLGRTFTEAEGLPDGPAVAILSHGLWREHFGASSGVIGRTVELDGRSYEVVGVMPDGFAFPDPDVRLWTPIPVDPAMTGFEGFNWRSIARLAPAVDVDDAERELRGLMGRIAERFELITPEMIANTGLAVVAEPYLETVVGDAKTALLILMGTVGFVLLIACANVANLLLVRAEGRRKEVAIRTAMGAGRRDLYGHFITESTVLTALGGAAGVLVAWQALRILRAFGPEGLPRLEEVAIDGSVVLFTGVLCALAAVAFGAVPVLRHRASGTSAALRDGYRGSTGDGSGNRVRRILVVGQVAFAFILLVGSGLMLRSFTSLLDVDPGFRTENVLTFRISLPRPSYPDRAAVAALHARLLERIEGLPGVEVAGAVNTLPLGGLSSADPLVVEGRESEAGEVPPILSGRAATPGYFEALGIPLRAGRMLEAGDADLPVVLLSERAAGKFFRDEDPLQQLVAQGLVEEHDAWSRVVGIVGDVHYRSLTEEPTGAIYYPVHPAEGVRGEWITRSMAYVVRTSVPPTSVLPGVRAALAEIDPNLPIASIRTLEQVTKRARSQMAFTLLLLGIAASIGLLLGAVGLYGVISYVTARRTREIGVRMALGAEAGKVRAMVMRQGMGVTAVGVGLGLLGAWALSRFMESVLYGVSATDPATFAGVSVLLLLVAAAATWIPAHRASRTDPIGALRAE